MCGVRPIRALCLALTLACIATSAWAQAPPVRVASGQPADAASEVRFAELRARAAAGTSVRLLVSMHLPPGVTPGTDSRVVRPAVARAQAAVLARAGARLLGARVATTLPLLVVTVDAEGLDALASDPDVDALEEDFAAVRRLDVSVPLVQADQLWTQGYRGTGWAVAVLDDGVDASHPAFGGRVVREACFSGHGVAASSQCPNGAIAQIGTGAAAPCVSCSHGTHVAGIAAGSNGVAPGAPIIAVQVFSKDALAYYSDILLAIDHVLTLADTVPVASLNLSIGGGTGYAPACDYLSSSMVNAFAALRDKGIAPVVAAGNSGATQSGLEFPGCLSNAVSVGATDDADAVASFSNTAAGMQLFAPGVFIIAPLPGGSTGSKSGTSMAAPHVTGAWSLLKQRLPTASVDAVLAALKATGLPVFDAGTNLSFPRIRIAQAAESLASFSVSPDTWAAPAAGGSTSVTLTSAATGATWSASSSQSWLTLSQSSGSGGATITLTTAAHTTSAMARTATATIAGQAVSVTQAGATPVLTIDPSTDWSPAASGASRQITITSSLADASWTASSAAGWLTVSAGTGTGSGAITLTAASNAASALSRMTTATIAGHTVTVTQDGATPTLSIAPTTWSAPAAQSSQEITVTSSHADAPWTASTNAAWLTVSASGGSGSDTITLTAAAHTTSALPRTATATIAGHTVSVTQAGASPSFSIDPTTWSPPASQASQAIAITSSLVDADWTAATSQAWLTVSASSGTGSGTVTVTAAPHTTSALPRTATATLGGEVLAVTQAGATPTLTIAPTTWAVASPGGSRVVTVTSSLADAAWTATSSAAWLTVSASSGSGSGSTTLTAAPNTETAQSRTATATIAGHTVSVTQDGYTMAISPTTATLPAGGGPVALSVSTTPAGVPWTASSDAGWVSIAPLTGNGTGLLTVVVLPHVGTVSSRVATVTVGGQSMTVTQQGTSPTFALSPEAISEHADGGTQVVTVSSNVPDAPWTASSPVPWVVVAPMQGVGSGVVTVAVAAHTTHAPRTATLSIAGRDIPVTQAAHQPTASTSERAWAASSAGGVHDVALDVPPELPAWVAWTDAPWVTVSPSQGLGDTHVTIAALPTTSNGNGLAATGLPSPVPPGSTSFTVTQAGGGSTRTATVVFAPAASPSVHTRYLAEGATSVFFDTRLALLNPGEVGTTATLRFLRAGQAAIDVPLAVPARTRRTVWPRDVEGLQDAEFSTVVSAAVPLVVDRTMTWDATGYGAHAETATAAAASRWYFAEGATHSGFSLFYLLQNPGNTTITVRARFLPASGAALEKSYQLPPRSRTNIWANVEEFPGLGRALAAGEFSAVLEAADGATFIAERAMYRSTHGRVFDAGHEAMGVAAPAPRWFLAEGRTGPYFDMFVLVANPSDVPATVRLSYLLDTGATLRRTFIAPANSRTTVWVDQEAFDGIAGLPLADAAISTTVESLNGVPLVVERAMWWPGDGATWHEAHAAAGTTETGTVWALAEGEVGGAAASETYVLIANTSAIPGRARVTVLLEDGTRHERVYPLAPLSRTNAAVRSDFADVMTEGRFGVVVEALGAGDDDPAPAIVVERAMYADAAGTRWAAGTSAVATRLR